MMASAVERIARAVLYEGYLLYPYRASALKNQQRWNFGVLYPAAWAAAQTGSDRSYFQMECVAECSPDSEMHISVRFLQLLAREDVGHQWQEGVERSVSLPPLTIAHLLQRGHVHDFVFPAGEERTENVIRRRCLLQGRIEASATELDANAARITVRVTNTSGAQSLDRNQILLHSLASAHAVLEMRNGQFVSQIDPPDALREAVAHSQSVGVWPVLVGKSGARDTMLGSPIILYDYPQVAPESKGDLFDGTEIDEILILRILTLTEAEKEEVRRTDERARQILERLESAPGEHLLELHGKIRSLDPIAGPMPDVRFKKGDRVRLRPHRRADIFDTILEGKIGIVEAVEQDFDNNVHLAVVVEDDPGRDLGEMRYIGHRFFFSSEEVERLA
jgi:hypothetical protein